jgi:hypothetical protein
VSTHGRELKKPFEATGDDDERTDVVLTLDISCTQDATQYVTSDDLILDPEFPEVCPINYRASSMDVLQVGPPGVLYKNHAGHSHQDS